MWHLNLFSKARVNTLYVYLPNARLVLIEAWTDMSQDMRKRCLGVNANSKDPGQPAEIYCLIRNFAILLLSSIVPNDSVGRQ